MSRRLGYLALALLGAIIALIVIARFRYPGKAPIKLSVESCNAELWKHVYEPGRLQVIEACTQVEGRVVSTRPASDGDLHIGLDPDQKSVLNLANVMHAHSELVVEVICDHTPTGSNMKADCGGFHYDVMVPKVGDRVRVTGAYVTDRGNGWNEIHPVTRIQPLR
ncbi:MAG TPA: hypothetical protein VKE71_14510 [Candidatus Angelobacter sp.]|nr:hypothetical protein [Candidatus Angelobacter sp.]